MFGRFADSAPQENRINAGYADRPLWRVSRVKCGLVFLTVNHSQATHTQNATQQRMAGMEATGRPACLEIWRGRTQKSATAPGTVLARKMDSQITTTVGADSGGAVRCTDLLEHPVSDVKQESKINELHLFAGAGGGILGGILCGHTTVCAVEIEPYARRVLLQRQRDGLLPRFPIWDDVRTFDGKPWRGLVHVVCGGFPCQDISAANQGAKGLDGERSGLWKEMARIIGEVRPRFAFVENSPMLVVRGLDRILGDFTEMGYDTKWGVFSAADVGARHIRERLWILADSDEIQRLEFQSRERRVDRFRAHHAPDWKRLRAKPDNLRNPESDSALSDWWKTEPRLARLDHGVADQMDRLAATGNGQVPSVAALAWRVLGGDENMSASAQCSNSGMNNSPSQYPDRKPAS